MAKNRAFIRSSQSVPKGFSDCSDHGEWQKMIEHFDIEVPQGLEEVMIKFARVALSRSNKQFSTIDMDDMIYLPLALGLTVPRYHLYDWVLVDEAQDTNPTRRALARKVLLPSGRLVAVGDPHQAIFGFTGTDNDALEQIRESFSATELPLSVSYRCPRAVVEHARRWVPHIEASDAAEEGSVVDLPYDDLLANLRTSDASETAILCRYNKYLVGLYFKMIREGVPGKMEGRAIGESLVKLATRWKSIKTVNALETKIKEYCEREVNRAIEREQETRAEYIEDECATLITLIERTRSLGKNQVSDMVDIIQEMFQDNVSGEGLITLCSAHKSKGLEWDTVFLLGREAFMPSVRAKQQWEIDQENNLIYVAVTRAKHELVEVTGVREETNPKGEK